MKKQLSLLFLLLFIITEANSQVIIRSRPMMRRKPPITQRNRNIPKFDPVLSLSIGYGIPNLDRYQLLDFFNYYRGSINQTGPVFTSLDYQFTRTMSVGIMVSYGKVSSPYYNYSNSSFAFTGSLKSTAIMVDLIRYIPVTGKISPYIKTAIGVNIWKQDYLDPSGNKAVLADDPSMLAYQTALGAKFKLSKQSSFFIEAGYGKYILSGGLSIKL